MDFEAIWLVQFQGAKFAVLGVGQRRGHLPGGRGYDDDDHEDDDDDDDDVFRSAHSERSKIQGVLRIRETIEFGFEETIFPRCQYVYRYVKMCTRLFRNPHPRSAAISVRC
jgi:hypothetical protein